MEREDSLYRNREETSSSSRQKDEYERTDEEKREFVDTLWNDIKDGARELVSQEPLLGGLIYSKILNEKNSFIRKINYF